MIYHRLNISRKTPNYTFRTAVRPTPSAVRHSPLKIRISLLHSDIGLICTITVHIEEREASVRSAARHRKRPPTPIRPWRLRPVLHAPGHGHGGRDAVRLHAVRRRGEPSASQAVRMSVRPAVTAAGRDDVGQAVGRTMRARRHGRGPSARRTDRDDVRAGPDVGTGREIDTWPVRVS